MNLKRFLNRVTYLKIIFTGALSLCLVSLLVSPGTQYDFEFHEKYNLITKVYISNVFANCSLDLATMVGNNLHQDHPCIISVIRRNILHPPSPVQVPYNLENVEMLPADQMRHILKLVNHKRGGFFVEFGTADSALESSTLYLETNLNWRGIVIQPYQESFDDLMRQKRKVWALPVSLSITPKFKLVAASKWKGPRGRVEAPLNEPFIDVLCLPLYSILLAVERTSIDFLSLDAEGYELAILETVPWTLVDVRALSVSRPLNSTDENLLIKSMNEYGYRNEPFKDKNLYFVKSRSPHLDKIE